MIDKIKSLLEQKIAKVVLSGVKKGVSSDFSKVTIKPFLSKDNLMYQLEYTVGNKVVHKNIEDVALPQEVEKLLKEVFSQCLIYGEKSDYHINCFNDKLKVKTLPSSTKTNITSHNHKKQYILNEGDNIDFLIYLGVMTKDCKIVKAKYNKFRQINKYLELLTDSINSLPQDKPLKIVDFGCGKAYLTFALYYYVVKILNRQAMITGLDLKEDVIDYCNKVAQELNYTNLEFKKGDIKDYNRTQDVDMVIMLHACDNATDEGIIQSLKFNAKVIIAVPCCQHEFFNQIKNDDANIMLQFGLIKERFSALATDSLRAQILKALGFDVTVMEFIETEHTPKNIAIKAIRKRGFDKAAFDEYNKFKTNFNLKPYIEERLIQENLI